MTARWWTHLDVVAYRHLGMSLGVKALGVDDVLLLRTRGRRSGQVREVLVAYVELDKTPIICGANGGWDRVPAWFVNLSVPAGRSRSSGTGAVRRSSRWSLRATSASGPSRRCSRPFPTSGSISPARAGAFPWCASRRSTRTAPIRVRQAGPRSYDGDDLLLAVPRASADKVRPGDYAAVDQSDVPQRPRGTAGAARDTRG